MALLRPLKGVNKGVDGVNKAVDGVNKAVEVGQSICWMGSMATIMISIDRWLQHYKRATVGYSGLPGGCELN